MKRIINVLVVEDNDYYNDLLVKTLKTARIAPEPEHKCHITINPFTDSMQCISKIRAGTFDNSDIIAFVDYYMGDGITGSHIIRLLKKHYHYSHVIMLSQSKAVSGKECSSMHDFFVFKDAHAPALCRLYLEQFIENKIS